MNKRKKDKKRIKIDCLECRAKFDIWVSNSNFPEDIEERVRKRFYQHCGICKKYGEYSDVEKDKKGRTKQV